MGILIFQEDCLKSATHASWVFDTRVCLSEPCFLRHNTELKCRSPMCGLLVEPKSFLFGTYIWPQSMKNVKNRSNFHEKMAVFAVLASYGSKRSFLLVFSARDDVVKVS